MIGSTTQDASMSKENSSGTTKRIMRCDSCNRKMIFAIDCVCKHKFCVSCRLPEAHNCKYDYTSEWKQALEKRNPVVVSEKVNKI